jgi:NADH-ubiquinone oxidoreductase chain 3
MEILILSIIFLFRVLLFLGIIWYYWNGLKDFKLNREKSRPFECGFDPVKSSRQSFSLRFFLLLIFFLVFDIEIVLLIELPLLVKELFFKFFLKILFFLVILILGFIEEWRRGALNWKL